MNKGTKHMTRPVSIPAGLAAGTLSALLWTLLGAAGVAKLVDSEVIAFERIGYGSMIVLLTASALGAFVAYQRIQKHRVPVCLGTGLAYFSCLAAMTALFFGGRFSGVWVTALMILLGTGATALAGLRGRGGKSGKRYRIPGR